MLRCRLFAGGLSIISSAPSHRCYLSLCSELSISVTCACSSYPWLFLASWSLLTPRSLLFLAAAVVGDKRSSSCSPALCMTRTARDTDDEDHTQTAGRSLCYVAMQEYGAQKRSLKSPPRGSLFTELEKAVGVTSAWVEFHQLQGMCTAPSSADRRRHTHKAILGLD